MELSKTYRPDGYCMIFLYLNGKRKNKLIHRLVAEAFIPNKEYKKEVNHIDGNKQNNSVNNLEWVTPSENAKHAFKKKLNSHTRNILQFDKDGNFIKQWDKISDVYNFLGIKDSGCISAVCKNKRKTAYGYIWKYAEGE